MSSEVPQKEKADTPSEEKLAVGQEELERQDVQQKIIDTASALDNALSSLPEIKAEAISLIRGAIQTETQKPHKDVRDFLRSVRRELGALSEREILLDMEKVIGRMLVEFREKEAAEFLARPLLQLLEMLKSKQDKREVVPRSLLNSALQKIKERVEEAVRSGRKEDFWGAETQLLKDLIDNREIHDEIIEHIGTKAMELVAFISSRERELQPAASENFAVIEKAKSDLLFYKELVKNLFAEQEEIAEGEERKEAPENEEMKNFEDVEILYGTLNRYLGVDTRPGYNFSRFFPRFLLEFLVRRQEARSTIPAEVMSDLVRRANRIASFVNRKRFLDLGQEIKRGELLPRVLRSLKIKMFLEVYPNAWGGFESINEQYAEQTKAFVAGLAKIYQETYRGPEAFKKATKNAVEAKDPDLDQALGFEKSLQDLAGFKPALLALREAYGMKDKQKGEEVEELFRKLQIARGRKGIFVGGRGAKERGTEARGGKGRKRRRHAEKGVDQKLKLARERLDNLFYQKRKIEELEGKEGVEMSEADKEFVKKTLGREARMGGLDEINRQIAGAERQINRLRRMRTTESDAQEGIYRIRKHADIEEDLSKAIRYLSPGIPIREAMRELDNLLFNI